MRSLASLSPRNQDGEHTVWIRPCNPSCQHLQPADRLTEHAALSSYWDKPSRPSCRGLDGNGQRCESQRPGILERSVLSKHLVTLPKVSTYHTGNSIARPRAVPKARPVTPQISLPKVPLPILSAQHVEHDEDMDDVSPVVNEEVSTFPVNAAAHQMVFTADAEPLQVLRAIPRRKTGRSIRGDQGSTRDSVRSAATATHIHD